MIIDAHCHAGKGDGLTGPWDTAAPLHLYKQRAQAAGIARTLLLPTFHSNYRAANRQLAQVVAGDPERFRAFAMVHPARDAGCISQLVAEALRCPGFCGIKVHRHDARITREVCETARAWRLPILYDVMGEAHPIDLVAAEYPDVAIVIPHLGSFADDWRAHMTVIDLLTRHPNVYTDSAGVRRFDYLAEAIRRAGAHKVIFGSDGPWLHPGVELAKIRLLGLSPQQEVLVLGGNLERIVSRNSIGVRPGPDAGRTRALRLVTGSSGSSTARACDRREKRPADGIRDPWAPGISALR